MCYGSYLTSLVRFIQVNSVRLPIHVGDKMVFCGTGLVERSSDDDAENIGSKARLILALRSSI